MESHKPIHSNWSNISCGRVYLTRIYGRLRFTARVIWAKVEERTPRMLSIWIITLWLMGKKIYTNWICRFLLLDPNFLGCLLNLLSWWLLGISHDGDFLTNFSVSNSQDRFEVRTTSVQICPEVNKTGKQTDVRRVYVYHWWFACAFGNTWVEWRMPWFFVFQDNALISRIHGFHMFFCGCYVHRCVCFRSGRG